MKTENNLEERFNEFIASGILDNNEFQEYEACIVYFDNLQDYLEKLTKSSMKKLGRGW